MLSLSDTCPLAIVALLLNFFLMQTSVSDGPDRLRSVSWTSDKFPPPGLGLARVSHQDQLPPSVSPGYREVVTGVVPLPDTSRPPPPCPPAAPSPLQLSQSPREPQAAPLTFDNARINANRKNR